MLTRNVPFAIIISRKGAHILPFSGFCVSFFYFERYKVQARFNIERERVDKLFYKSYKNDFCLFQFHSQIEIYFVDEGEMEMLVDGKPMLLKAPAVSVAFSYGTHAYKTPESSRSSVLLIPARLCEEFLAAVRAKRLDTPYITDPELYRELKSLYNSVIAAEGNKIKQLGYVYTLLGTIFERMPLSDSDAELDTQLASRLLFYIDENFASGITPRSVAQHFGYSQSYISRYFSSSFGTTLTHYLTSVRLRNAIMLMRDGKHDITYCALESGFASMRTFYRAFHNEFGMTPTEYIAQGI